MGFATENLKNFAPVCEVSHQKKPGPDTPVPKCYIKNKTAKIIFF
jgi:hypothetical protein